MVKPVAHAEHRRRRNSELRQCSVRCRFQFFYRGVICGHLIKCLAYYFHILTVCPILQALRLLKSLCCGRYEPYFRSVCCHVLVCLDTPCDLLALVEPAQRFRPCKSRSRIVFFLRRQHKFQVDLVVGIVVNQYSELSTFRKEIIEVLADLDNLVYGLL